MTGIIARKTILNFKNPIELLIIILLILYSFVVINGYLLNFFNFHLNVINITFALAIEIILFILFFKIKLTSYRKSIIYCLVIFAIVFIYSLYFSPAFLPISYSVDAVHHYVLMDYLYYHESLPNLNYSYYMQEMVQYPYGPSLFTVYISKIFGIELVETMQILVFAAAGLLAVLVYLIAKELLNEYNLPKGYGEILSLASPFMLFSVPIYFFGQYLNDSFYYSMIFGELLVIGTLFTLLRIEKNENAWLNFFFILSLGIIFTYSLFLIIPLMATAIWLSFNSNIRKSLSFKHIIIYTFLLIGLFILYSFERFDIGKTILQHEGWTVVPVISNFNPIFIILVISGIFLYGMENEGRIKKISFIYIAVLFIEMYTFLFINQYGLIAKYFAYKTFYLQVLISSPFVCIPIAHLIKHIDNQDSKYKKIFSEITLFGSLLIIILISVYTLTAYPIYSQPILTKDDIKISQYTANYRFQNNISDENITIIAPNLASYWIGNGFLHMEKDYAVRKYLANNKMANIEDWVNNTKSSYLITKVEYINIDYFKNNLNINFSIENRKGTTFFLKKI